MEKLAPVCWCKSNQLVDKNRRSIAKTLTWRITATLTTFLISWIVTGSLVMGLGIASIEFWAKIILYFYHERIWNNIKWGIE